MPVITYTAKREIEETDFRVASEDITVIGSGGSPEESPPVNQFVIESSPGNSLAGLSDGEWVRSTGFDESGNNRWSQVDGDSTDSVINVLHDLYDEPSGAPAVLQGHVRGSGESYSLEFNAERNDPSSKITRHSHVPLGGGVGETLFVRNEHYIEFVTSFIDEDDIPQWKEFIASVAARETFTLDLYGTLAVPDEPLTVVLESEEHRPARVGTLRRYQYTLRVKIVE